MGEHVKYSISEAVEETSSGINLSHFDKVAFDRVLNSDLPPKVKTKLFAQLARYNALYMVSCAGSGHLGSSFSSLDIVSWLYLNVLQENDRYFSSKGHDAPGLYSVHTALGIIPFDKIHELRRMGGLPGHPDVSTPGACTNTGSLGMGVSKAKGFLFADSVCGVSDSQVYVLTGDGELQEGHFWESLVSAANDKEQRLTVIVDHNKIQSDTYVSDVSDLGNLEAKFTAFGWDVVRIDGHDYDALEEVLSSQRSNRKPLAVIADTIKGCGVSFMEHTAMSSDQVFYKYHSGAPSVEEYKRACSELYAEIDKLASGNSIDISNPVDRNITPLTISQNCERMIPAYSEEILSLAKENPKLVALDADLILDTGLIPFKEQYPERFVECGIAEQDMVSQAGTMALAGAVPIVHSFACFLTTRASEQIYNNCSQYSKVVYVGSLAGVLPGGPGHSHQAVRDITGMLAMPGLTVLEPANAAQVRKALRWAVNDNDGSTYIRLTSIPYELDSSIAENEDFIPGRGAKVREGNDIAIICFGPIMSHQAMQAADILSEKGVNGSVIVTPWVNKIDIAWLEGVIKNTSMVVMLENQYVESGAGGHYIATMAISGLLADKKVMSMGLEELPACGRNEEVLEYHGLNASKIASAIFEKYSS